MTFWRRGQKEDSPTAKIGQCYGQADFLAELLPASTSPDRIAVKLGGRAILVKVAQIDWVEAHDNYVKLNTGTQVHLLRATLAAMEERLTGGRFVRASRSAIVNLDRIKELQPLFHGEYVATLDSGTKVTISRQFREKIRALLGGF